MIKRKVCLRLQAVVCIALAVYLSVSAITIYREGSARREEHPMESIYTPEDVAEKLLLAAPLLFISAGLMIVGFVSESKDEEAEKPVRKGKSLRGANSTDALKARKRSKSEAGYGGSGLMKKKWILQAAVFIAAIVFIVAGVFNGSARDVLYKAVTICTECIGLG